MQIPGPAIIPLPTSPTKAEVRTRATGQIAPHAQAATLAPVGKAGEGMCRAMECVTHG
jgi:hypothetical protein